MAAWHIDAGSRWRAVTSEQIKDPVLDKADPPATDRRRPGPREFRNPYLIKLLRSRYHTPNITGTNDPDESDQDDLRFPTGVAVGLGLSLFLWAGIAVLTVVLYRLFR